MTSMAYPKGCPAHNRMTREKFWSKVDMSGGPDACWPWLGATNSTGYGSVGYEGSVYCSHRLAAFFEGLVASPRQPSRKDDGHVLHECDNRICCNKHHFKIGTYRQNLLDCFARGRRITTLEQFRGKHTMGRRRVCVV